LLKDASQREVIGTVRQVLRGESLVNPSLAARLLQRLAQDTAGRAAPAAPPLTGRERDVLALLVQGLTNREIARELILSPGTVKGHVEHIIGKLAVSDRTQAAVRAIELGLVSPSSPG